MLKVVICPKTSQPIGLVDVTENTKEIIVCHVTAHNSALSIEEPVGRYNAKVSASKKALDSFYKRYEHALDQPKVTFHKAAYSLPEFYKIER